MELQKYSTIKDINVLEFAIFCIENLSIKLTKDTQIVYEALTEKSDILDTYIIPNFDTLHTQDKEYILNDILSIIEEEGVDL